jgi:hypothetical protein
MTRNGNRVRDNQRLSLRIDCYLSPECASEAALRENITRALAIEKIEAELSLRRIDDNEAMALGVTGSPSVFINGKELQPQGTAGFS